MAWDKSFVYFGTSDFSRQVLAGLLFAKIKPVLVVTTQAKAAGRGWHTNLTPVGSLAQAENLPWLEVKSLKHGFPEVLIGSQADFGLLAAFGRILPPELLSLYKFGIINIHPSLLPRYRGSAPIQSAILDNAEVTGVTLIKLDQEVDHGPILGQKSVAIGENNALELGNKLAQLAISQILEYVPEYLTGKLILQPQDHKLATFTKQITRQDGQANFNLMADELNNRRRAFTPWPGLWTSWQGKRVKLIKTAAVAKELKIGQVSLVDKQVLIGCGNRSALLINEIQLADGKVQTSSSFINGHKEFIGSFLPS